MEDVSLTVRRGETLGIVGESGCGKSTTARLMLRLIDPTGGTIRFDGRDITGVSTRGLRPLRREMQMIFQDPYASLNPRKTVEQIVLQPFAIHGGVSRREAKLRVRELLRVVGPQPRAREPLPTRVLGRSATADRDRSRARAEPEADRVRRAGLGARRLRPGADPQPPALAPGRVQPHVRLHLARPLRHAADLLAHRGHVPRARRRARRLGADLRAAEASLHGGAHLGSPPCRR